MKANVGNNVMIPADYEARTMLANKHPGDVVEFQVLNPRSLQFNAYIFAVISKLAKAHGVDVEGMQCRLLVETNRFRLIRITQGKRVMVLPSMSKASWSMKMLREFWTDARAVILDKLLVGLRDADRRGEECGQGANDCYDHQRRRCALKNHMRARGHVHASRDHRRCVNQCRNRRRAFHGIGQPDIEWKLCGFSGRAD